MVYCGPLSKACLPCRRRRLRCDLQEPTCTPCARAQLKCSGYRDINALRIKDESDAVKRRVHTRKSLKVVPESIVVSIRSQARDIFYHDYVVGFNKPFDFLQTFRSSTSRDEHLDRSVDAVSLAYLASQRHSVSAEKEARQNYISAINHTTVALQTFDQAKQDSTILAILLLDLYEKMTNKIATFGGGWAAHLSGALTLVQLRGNEQFNDPSVRRMLTRLGTNLLISCVASDTPVLPDLITLRNTIAAHFTSSLDPKWLETDLVIEFARLRQEIDKGVLAGSKATLALVELDAKFVRLGMEVPPTWQYKTIQVKVKSRHHFESFHHIHPAEHVAQMWNTLRLTRIVLNELICFRCLDTYGRLRSDFDLKAIHERASRSIIEMASDICASIPQYIEDSPTTLLPPSTKMASSSNLPNHDTRISPVAPPNPTNHLPCYRLIFPLFVVAQSSALPPAFREWAIKELHFMADYHGIKNAMMVADMLESGQTKPVWEMYAMLGSYAFVC
ncbi:MAG: hypothetical protein Q9182_006356 [Xanthomendoza sp. 2 TL-2023]